MARSQNQTFDNVGAPDSYLTMGECKRIRVIEKDRTVTTLAEYNVYFPNSIDGSASPYRGGEAFVLTGRFSQATRPFAIETTNVAAAVFVIEEFGEA